MGIEMQDAGLLTMQVNKCEDGTYEVSLLVSGLPSEEHANAAMEFIQDMLCGEEVTVN